MAEYRTTGVNDGVRVERRGGAGRTIGIIALVALVIVALLFATGFFRANVSGGEAPAVSVSGGSLPSVDVDSKRVVVGTRQETVDVPTVQTRRETVSVPTVGVSEGSTDGNRR